MIPSNADLTLFHLFENGDQLLAFDITFELPGAVTARPYDVVRRASGGSYFIAFDGSAEHLPWNAGDLDAAWVMFLAGFIFKDGFENP